MRFILTLGRRSLEEFIADNCTQMAAAISYYAVFSLFPLLIFVVGVMGLFLQDSGLQKEVIDAVLESVPLTQDEGRDVVTEAVRGVAGVGSGALGILGLLGMAWSASSMFGVVRHSLNKAFDVERRRPFVQQKLMDLAMVLGAVLIFLASIAATAFLRSVRAFSDELAGLGEAAEAAGILWDAASLAVPFGISFVAFLVLYWTVPSARLRPRDVWPGALVAAVLFEAGKVGFAVYLENFGNYDVVFGSLGAAAAFLFWVFVSANIMLLGAEVASEYPGVRRGEYAEREAAAPLPLRERVRRALRGLFFSDRGDESAGEGPPRPNRRA